MHPPRERPSYVTILTAVAALVGALLAVLLTTVADVTVNPAVWVLLVVCVTALATAVAILVLTTGTVPQAPRRQAPPPPPPPRSDWHQRLPRRQSSAPPPPRTPASRAPELQTTPGVQVVPLEEGTRDWWTKSGPAEAETANDRGPAPELASYVASGAAFVAQCPNCGDFRIDVSRGNPAHSFRCRNPGCGAQWQWTPGTEWPPVVVRRNLTTPQPGHERR